MGRFDHLYLRQRYDISNNFLQHLHLTEAVLPFYSWSLIAYAMRSDPDGFDTETYRPIFQRHSPQRFDPSLVRGENRHAQDQCFEALRAMGGTGGRDD